MAHDVSELFAIAVQMGQSTLIIHRDPAVVGPIVHILEDAGWRGAVARCREHAALLSLPSVPAIVIAEASGIPGDLALMAASLREQFPGCKVLALLAASYPQPDEAEAAGLDGALREPFGRSEVLAALKQVSSEPTHRALEAVPLVENWLAPVTRTFMEQAGRLAMHEGTVLLLGESGTGKDHLARWIHAQSARRTGPFFTINCAALSRELAESELFGHESGAFTGTKGRKRGLLELAERGTLLLDEVGELDPALQAKLLTFFDSRTFVRVGGERHISVSARILAATNRDLLLEVSRGAFRRDLYYRLAVAPLQVPPLRERMDDLPLLVAVLLRVLQQELGLPELPELEEGAIGGLCSYDWPGNIRELRNVLERAIMLSGRRTLRRQDLCLPGSGTDWHILVRFPELGSTLHDVTRDVARRIVAEALHRASSKQEAARLLGLSRHALAHQLRVLGLIDPEPSLPLASTVPASSSR